MLSVLNSEKIFESSKKMSVDRTKHFPFLIDKIHIFKFLFTHNYNIKFNFYKVFRIIYRQFSVKLKFFFRIKIGHLKLPLILSKCRSFELKLTTVARALNTSITLVIYSSTSRHQCRTAAERLPTTFFYLILI